MTEPVLSNLPQDAVIAFLGPLGTFTHAAVDRYFGPDARKHSVATIDEVFAQVQAGAARYGVVPVENSTEGAVNTTQDCLMDTDARIIGELIVPVEQNFLLRRDADPARIRRIVSHRQSLGQCRHWLSAHWPEVEKQEVSSNAEAARLASEDPYTAAIAGERAAKLYDLVVVNARIQDQQNNCTRFLVLANEDTQPTGRDKTSILVYTENKPGALFRVLEPFNTHQVSLTKIETRPARDIAWAYVFFIDFEGHVQDAPVRKVLEQLKSCTVRIKQLGSYPMAQVNP
ncbi:MAG: prephenate dehydratase [Gammaproteobacteria bacterium]|nr:prephenate dehydratase [Pseudomonadales bacterium]MCP5331175.1 prephenate dehydratase [Pseudomonadales bacterium]